MPWGFAAVAGASLIGSAITAGAAGRAADVQGRAVDNSSAVQWDMFNTARNDLAPFVGAGTNALPLIYQLFGITPGSPGTPGTPGTDGGVMSGVDENGFPVYTTGSGPGTPGTPGTDPTIDINSPFIAKPTGFSPSSTQFNFGAFQNDIPKLNPGTLSFGPAQTPADFSGTAPFSFDAKSFEGSPGYKFALDQGIEAVVNRASRAGGTMGGNTLRGIADYATGLASQDYGNEFARQLGTHQTNFGNALSTYQLNADKNLSTYLANWDVERGKFDANTGAQAQANQINFDQALAKYMADFGTASTEFGTNYDVARDIFSTNYGVDQNYKSNIMNMLTTLLGVGQSSAAGTANLGVQTGANVGNNLIQGGNAAAAGIMGGANAWSGGLNNLAQMAMMYKMFGGG